MRFLSTQWLFPRPNETVERSIFEHFLVYYSPIVIGLNFLINGFSIASTLDLSGAAERRPFIQIVRLMRHDSLFEAAQLALW